MREQHLVPAAFSLAAVLLVWGTWGGSPVNSDDVMYMEMAREMVRTGEWLELQWQGQPIFQRPPLPVWPVAFLGALFGWEVFWMRLPSVLMGILALGFMAGIGRRLVRDPRGEALALLLVPATHLFFYHARRTMTDTMLLAAVLAMLHFYLKARENPRWLVASAAAAGWVVMTKSVLVALPLLLVFGDLFLGPDRRLLRSRHLAWAVAIGVAVLAPWHLVMTLRHGRCFWSEYLGFNVLERAASSLIFAPDPFHYVSHAIRFEGPLPYLFAIALVAVAVRWVRSRAREDRFLLLWVVVFFLPFQLSSTRLYHYLMPLLPALALMTGRTLGPHLRRPLLAGAVALAVLGIFFANNGWNLLVADYSPDQIRFHRIVQERGHPGARLVAWNHYELTLFFLEDRPVRMVTDDDGFFATLDGIPMFHKAGAVQQTTAADFLGRLSAGPFHCVTTKAELPVLCGPVSVRCGPGGWTVLDGTRAVLVTNALAPEDAP